MRTVVMIQARMGSQRMPGKILAPLAGIPLLAHVVRRLQIAASADADSWEVRVATTSLSADDLTEAWCEHWQVPCHRGSNEDVLARYCSAAADLDDQDLLIRATADNPLYCPRRTRDLWQSHCLANVDYSCVRNLSYVVPEVMKVSALRRMEALAQDSYCREHVTPYFRQPDVPFRVQQFEPAWNGLQSQWRLTIDTFQEYVRMRQLFERLQCRDREPTLNDVYEDCQAHWTSAETL